MKPPVTCGELGTARQASYLIWFTEKTHILWKGKGGFGVSGKTGTEQCLSHTFLETAKVSRDHSDLWKMTPHSGQNQRPL